MIYIKKTRFLCGSQEPLSSSPASEALKKRFFRCVGGVPHVILWGIEPDDLNENIRKALGVRPETIQNVKITTKACRCAMNYCLGNPNPFQRYEISSLKPQASFDLINLLRSKFTFSSRIFSFQNDFEVRTALHPLQSKFSRVAAYYWGLKASIEKRCASVRIIQSASSTDWALRADLKYIQKLLTPYSSGGAAAAMLGSNGAVKPAYGTMSLQAELQRAI